jgi:transketolase
MRALSNLTIHSPSDSVIAAELGRQVGTFGGPAYLRLDRGKWPSLAEEVDLSAGIRTVRGGANQIAIVSTGIMVHRALEVAKELENKGINARVIDLYRLKPLNSSELIGALAQFEAVATIEEQTINGGLGSIIAEAMADGDLVKPLKRFAISDGKLYAYGTRDRLHAERRLDAPSMATDLSEWLRRRSVGKNKILERTP